MYVFIDFNEDPSSKNGTLQQIVNFTCAVSNCSRPPTISADDRIFICKQPGTCNLSYCRSVCTVTLTENDNNTRIRCETDDFLFSKNATILVQS